MKIGRDCPALGIAKHSRPRPSWNPLRPSPSRVSGQKGRDVEEGESLNVVDNIAKNCLIFRLRKLNRIVTGIYDTLLQDLSLKTSQLNILVVTGRFGVAQRARLCSTLQMDMSTLSRNVARLEQRGWLETIASGDQRSRPVRLTEEGHAILRQAHPIWQEGQRQAAALLGEEGKVFLFRMNKMLDQQTSTERT